MRFSKASVYSQGSRIALLFTLVLSIKAENLTIPPQGVWKCISGRCNEIGFLAFSKRELYEIAEFEYGSESCVQFKSAKCAKEKCELGDPPPEWTIGFRVIFINPKKIKVENRWLGGPTKATNDFSEFVKISEDQVKCREFSNYLSIKKFTQ